MGRDQRKENLDYFKKQHPEAYKAYEEFGKAIHEKGGPLSERERCLVKVAVAAVSQFDHALKSHIERALEAKCKPAEIEHAILLTASTTGFPRMMEALLVLREAVKP